MNEKITTPIERVTSLLAEMTDRAMEAERTRDAALEDAANWYQHFKNKAEKLEEAETALSEMAAERAVLKDELEQLNEENKKLRLALVEMVENMQKGETANG
jgi:cell shape-determining protein MreC